MQACLMAMLGKVYLHTRGAKEIEKKWARVVIKITDFFQKDHCKRANKREQPVVDFILSRNLDKQTIGKR